MFFSQDCYSEKSFNMEEEGTQTPFRARKEEVKSSSLRAYAKFLFNFGKLSVLLQHAKTKILMVAFGFGKMIKGISKTNYRLILLRIRSV